MKLKYLEGLPGLGLSKGKIVTMQIYFDKITINKFTIYLQNVRYLTAIEENNEIYINIDYSDDKGYSYKLILSDDIKNNENINQVVDLIRDYKNDLLTYKKDDGKEPVAINNSNQGCLLFIIGAVILFIILAVNGCFKDNSSSIPKYYQDHPEEYQKLLDEEEYNAKLKQEIKNRQDELNTPEYEKFK